MIAKAPTARSAALRNRPLSRCVPASRSRASASATRRPARVQHLQVSHPDQRHQRIRRPPVGGPVELAHHRENF